MSGTAECNANEKGVLKSTDPKTREKALSILKEIAGGQMPCTSGEAAGQVSVLGGLGKGTASASFSMGCEEVGVAIDAL